MQHVHGIFYPPLSFITQYVVCLWFTSGSWLFCWAAAIFLCLFGQAKPTANHVTLDSWPSSRPKSYPSSQQPNQESKFIHFPLRWRDEKNHKRSNLSTLLGTSNSDLLGHFGRIPIHLREKNIQFSHLVVKFACRMSDLSNASPRGSTPVPRILTPRYPGAFLEILFFGKGFKSNWVQKLPTKKTNINS